ncbi:hypothetical protein IAT38_006085 [Cryptococcus sp. DSM 104549]
MAPHPFLVNQTPFLPTSKPISPSVYACTTSTHNRNQSSTSINTIASEASTTSTTSTSTSFLSYTPPPPIDGKCLLWMQRESEAEHIFGSVSRRGKSLSFEERSVLRSIEENKRQAEEEEARRAQKAERRKGVVGKWF